MFLCVRCAFVGLMKEWLSQGARNKQCQEWDNHMFLAPWLNFLYTICYTCKMLGQASFLIMWPETCRNPILNYSNSIYRICITVRTNKHAYNIQYGHGNFRRQNRQVYSRQYKESVHYLTVRRTDKKFFFWGGGGIPGNKMCFFENNFQQIFSKELDWSHLT